MIHWLYERALLRGIEMLPGHLCFMITESDMAASPWKLSEVTGWCLLVNVQLAEKNRRQGSREQRPIPAIQGLTFHISTVDPAHLSPYLEMIRKVGDHARLHLHIGDTTEILGEGMDVCVAVGKSGREEIVSCIRRISHLPLFSRPRDKNRRVAPYRLSHLAVSVFGIVLFGCELEVVSEDRFFQGSS
jgi:undecaprenyl diphosphate synthase